MVHDPGIYEKKPQSGEFVLLAKIFAAIGIAFILGHGASEEATRAEVKDLHEALNRAQTEITCLKTEPREPTASCSMLVAKPALKP